MRRRHLFSALTLAAIGVGGVALRAGPEPGAQLPLPGFTQPPVALGSPVYVGATGCAAAGCHNAQGPLGSEGSEFSTWVHDPHIRAFEVLKGPRSTQIVKNLGGDWDPDASKEARCIACHATPARVGCNPLEQFSDGVSCESCHGAAGHWRSMHYQPEWKAMSTEAKRSLGFLDLRDLETRVTNCAGCHVGEVAGNVVKDVNHDLIAAGHPRLAFEYSAYHQIYPRHWGRYQEVRPRGPYGADLELKHWAVGQVASAKASVELLLARAAKAGTHPWPEFSEYGCFACHHSLTGDEGDAKAWRKNSRFAGLKVGSLPYGTWYLPRLDSIGPEVGLPPLPADLAAKLTNAMAAAYPEPAAVTGEATAVRSALDRWLAAVRPSGDVSVPATKALFDKLVADGLMANATDWEDATQRYLALAAAHQSLAQRKAIGPERRDALLNVRKPLVFPIAPRRFDSPADFTPAKFRDALKQLQAP